MEHFLFRLILFLGFIASMFFLAGRVSFKWELVFLFLNPCLLLFIFHFAGGIDTFSAVLIIISFIFSGWLVWRNYALPFETLKKIIKESDFEGILKQLNSPSSEIDTSESEDSTASAIFKFFDEIEKQSLSGEIKSVFSSLKIYAQKLREEKGKVDKMNKMYLYLTNLARYSFSETDKEKLLKEIGNFVEYVFQDKQVILWSEEMQKFIKGHGLSLSDIERIRMGKMEDDKEGYVAFPINKNGDNYAFIILKGNVGPHERTFVYLVSKFAESVLKRIDRENEIQLKAITDPLTGIYNRRYFVTHLAQQFSKYKRFKKAYSVIIFDIDNFKNLNDKYGHFIGDEILKGFAETMKNAVRGYDVPARFGGDEFILLIEDVPKDDAVKIAKRISQKFSEFKDIKTMLDEDISVSWGLASVDEASSSYDEILKLADKRLFKAKSLGKGIGVWD